jgi:O-antigen ligase
VSVAHPVDRLSGVLYMGILASLPLFSIRPFSGELSAPLMFFLAIGLVAALRIVGRLEIPKVFSALDLAICIYLLIALATLLKATDPDASFAFLKSVVYFLCYMALKMALASMTAEQVHAYTRRGILLGTAGFILVVLGALARTGGMGLLGGVPSYSGFTLPVFAAIDVAFGQGRADFASVDVMRNAVAEAFALYFLVAVGLGFRGRLLTLAAAGGNAILALGMFSRRALVAIVLGIFLGALRIEATPRRFDALVVLLLALVLFSVATTGGGGGGDSRHADLTDAARARQYEEALDRFAAAPLLGEGFGAKLSTDQYVHNFVLAGMMMMGVLGLAATLAVLGPMVLELFRGMVEPRAPWTSFLLLIPLLGMAVGSTVQGILTLAGWTALALHEVSRARMQAGGEA